MCLLARIGKVSKFKVSRILESSVAGRRVQVRTEGILVEHHQVRQSLKELSLLEIGLHRNALADIPERGGVKG